jgi:CHAT domain-containing protein
MSGETDNPAERAGGQGGALVVRPGGLPVLRSAASQAGDDAGPRQTIHFNRPSGGGGGLLPRIEIADRQLRDVTSDALDAIALANDPLRVFRRAGVLVRLHVEEDTNKVVLQPLTGKALRNHLARVADWFRDLVATAAPNAVVGDIEAITDLVGLPALDAVVTCPVVTRHGAILTQPGYHERARLWFQPDPDLALPAIPSHPSEAEVRQAQLPEDAALLAWLDLNELLQAAGRRGDHWACLLRRQGLPAWIRLPGTGPGGSWTEADARLPVEVRGAVATRPADVTADWQRPAGRLYRQRLRPLAERLAAGDGLPAVRELIVLPSSALGEIPVEALLAARPTNAPALTVSYAPSATLFAYLRERRGDRTTEKAEPGRLLALGDPAFARRSLSAAEASHLAARGDDFAPLPGSRREVEAVARLFPRADILLGNAASEQRLDQLAEQGRLRGYRYLHFATHGVVDFAQPLRSFLALSQEGLPDPIEQVLHGRPAYSGRLTAADILRRWQLDADLVTLSACRSGLGRYELGEGYIGFAQGLLLAGAHSLVLSEWSVDDDATALLMTRFYQNLLGKRPGLDRPLPKAEALREAKEWLRNLDAAEVGEHLAALPRGTVEAKRTAPSAPKPYAHPYYWAGFILVGDPD